MKPLFSIVIANYNYGRFLEDALQSILSQGLGDEVEIIVCDAASTDNSVEVIRKYADKIAWWCSEQDGGQSAAFNKGFAHATGRFLTWLNADDVFFPGALKAVAKEIEKHPDCEWFVGSTSWVDEHLRIKRVFRAHKFSVLRGYFAGANACGPSSFFTKRLLQKVGGIDETLHYAMDNDLWHRFFRNEHAQYCRTTANVWAYRIHAESKLSGADVSAEKIARENREKALAEGRLLRQRYPQCDTWFRPWAVRLSTSLLDWAIAAWLTFRLKGRLVSEC